MMDDPELRSMRIEHRLLGSITIFASPRMAPYLVTSSGVRWDIEELMAMRGVPREMILSIHQAKAILQGKA